MSESKKTQNWGMGLLKMSMAFLGGAAAGATVVALLTPRSGPEVREGINKFINDSRQNLASMPEAIQEATGAAKEAFTQSMASSGNGVDADADQQAEATAGA